MVSSSQCRNPNEISVKGTRSPTAMDQQLKILIHTLSRTRMLVDSGENITKWKTMELLR